MDRTAYLRSLIGKPYAKGGEGPDRFDCYGLVRAVSHEIFGRELPSREEAVHGRAGRWRRTPGDKPQDGAVVFMMIGPGRHVGIYLLHEGGVLHAVEPQNWTPGDRRAAVRFERLWALSLGGFTRIRMYVPHDASAQD